MTSVVSLPSWLLVVLGVSLCASVAVVARWAMRRWLGEETDRVSMVSGPLMPALGAMFSLLAALALNAEATQLHTASENASLEAAASSRLAWAATSPGFHTAKIHREQLAYLDATRGKEWGDGNGDGDPQAKTALASLERTVRADAAQKTVSTAQAGELLTALDAVSVARRQRLAAIQGMLPDLDLVVVVAAGLALVVNSAGLAVSHRPGVALLTGGLVLVIGLTLALLIAVSAPFQGGFIVSAKPVDLVITDLSSGMFRR